MALPPTESGQAPQLAEPAADDRPATMLGHFAMRGNLTAGPGAWLGDPAAGFALEALMLAPAAEGPPQHSPAPEYQLLYSDGLRTPWTPAGQLCGSMGLGLACLGLRFRLSAETAAFFDCRYDVAFTDGSRQENLTSTEMAAAPAGAAVAAVRLFVTPRAATPLIVLNDIDVNQPPAWDSSDRPDDPTVRLRLLSPAFPTRPPVIRHSERIPTEFAGAMNVSFGRRVFPGRSVTLRLIEQATVVGEGAVFDRDLALVPGTGRLFEPAAVDEMRAVARAARQGTPRHIAGLSVLCRSRAAQNYGHFLVEMFPKAWLASRLLSQRHPTYIVAASSLEATAREALSGIGINPFAISSASEAAVICDSLVVIDGLTHHGVFQSPLCAQALRALAAPIPAGDARKLFVPRFAATRPLQNQEAVAAALAESGFTIVDPAALPLREQIALFKGADLVVGPLGAALTNTAFCRPGTRVIALTAQSFPDTFFWFLAQHCGLQYEEIRGRDVSGTPEVRQSWNAGFTLDEADIASLATL
ncbi:glycosyltransferase family 61 protein [Acidisoma sp. 7E03]